MTSALRSNLQWDLPEHHALADPDQLTPLLPLLHDLRVPKDGGGNQRGAERAPRPTRAGEGLQHAVPCLERGPVCLQPVADLERRSVGGELSPVTAMSGPARAGSGAAVIQSMISRSGEAKLAASRPSRSDDRSLVQPLFFTKVHRASSFTWDPSSSRRISAFPRALWSAARRSQSG
jgi:hypothetical protein